MQLTYYRFPADMPIRDCYDAWEKGREGYKSPPADMTDAELEEEWPRQQLCNVRTAKKFLRKYGGVAWTEHIDRDGCIFETTPILAKGSNKKLSYGVTYNQHL